MRTKLTSAALVISALVFGTVLLTGNNRTQFVSDGSTYFAEIAEDGTVLRVIVADQSFIDSGAVGHPDNWVETVPDGSKRKNYAGKGYKYDKQRDEFVPPKPQKLDEGFEIEFDPETARWRAKKI